MVKLIITNFNCRKSKGFQIVSSKNGKSKEIYRDFFNKEDTSLLDNIVEDFFKEREVSKACYILKSKVDNIYTFIDLSEYESLDLDNKMKLRDLYEVKWFFIKFRDNSILKVDIMGEGLIEEVKVLSKTN